MKKLYIIGGVVLLVITAGLLYYFVFAKNLSGRIVIPYIAHQKPRVDPHIPGAISLSDKLDEVLFDGLFNVAANPSGITYEDGLGELTGIDDKNIVTIRLKPKKRWHSSYGVTMVKDEVTISAKQAVSFAASDLKFTLNRIRSLGSMSPDFILVSQAVNDFTFSGPDESGDIRFKFRSDRMWTDADIKEVLSFKILPATSQMDAPAYNIGTGPYLYAGEFENTIYYHQSPGGQAQIPQVLLKPFIDNSTFATELRNSNINSLLNTPFGSISPILADTKKFFHKSSISTCFFALLFNTQRLNQEQRVALRALISNTQLVKRFFKIGTMQQRHIANYKGEGNNYKDYLNYSMFPTTTYYVQEQVVTPLKRHGKPDLSILPDTVRVQTCLNYGYREELASLVEIINDPGVFGGKVKAAAVSNTQIKLGEYDAVLVPVTGYRSNFLFDLYDILLREPDFAVKRIHLKTRAGSKGEVTIDPSSFTPSRNFLNLDARREDGDFENIKKLLEYVYGFMSTSEIGDKQAYAQYIDQLDQDMALGSWLFSLPSLAYFRTQFDESTIDLYGIASQLSTIEKWQEQKKR